MEKKLFLYFFFFIVIISNSYSEKRSYKIKYDNTIQQLTIKENIICRFDENGKIIINKHFGYLFRIKSIKVIEDTLIYYPKYSDKINRFEIVFNEFKNKTVEIEINYTIFMALKKSFVLSFDNFYFPLDFLNIQDNLSNNNDTNFKLMDFNIEVDIPSDWSVISEGIVSSNINNKRNIINLEISAPVYPVIVAGKNIYSRIKIVEGKELQFFYKKNKNEGVFDSLENDNEIFFRLSNYKNYIDSYLEIESSPPLKFLVLPMSDLIVNLYDTVLLNKLYMKFSVKNRNPLSEYYIFHSIAMQILSKKINHRTYCNDYWIAEGLAHLITTDFLSENGCGTLNELNTNQIAKFFQGNKDSPYQTFSEKFRDYIRFGAIKDITSNNKNPLLSYTVKAKTINNHYSTQIFFSIRNILGKDNFKNFIRIFFSKTNNSYLTTKDLLSFLEENYKTVEFGGINSLVNSYPVIDYALVRKDNSIFIYRRQGSVTLPVVIEYQFKDKSKKREVIYINRDIMKLNVDKNTILNIIIDPDNLIEEVNEANNFYIIPVRFSLIAPPILQNKYNIVFNNSLCTYDKSNYIGFSLNGGWNAKPFNINSIHRPYILWGLDFGYGSPIVNQGKDHDFFVNTFYENSLNHQLSWAPQIYASTFVNRTTLINKIGLQGFFPKVVNTEHDPFFFNHSWDFCTDLFFKYPDKDNINFDLKINTGYKTYFKVWTFTVESINGFNINFSNMIPKSIDIGGTLNLELDLDFIEIGNLTGILKSIHFSEVGYEYITPKFVRFNTINNTTNYFDKISSRMIYAEGIGINLNLDKYDFIFNSAHILFKAVLYREPLLDSIVSIGFGLSEDLYFTFHNWESPYFRADLFCGTFVIEIFKKTTFLFKIPIFSSVFFDGNNFNYQPGVFFEVRSFM